VSGSVQVDTNGDGLGDVGLGGVTLTLKTGAGSTLVTTTTASDGSYSFLVVPGSYQVVQSLPAGYDFLSDKDGGDAFTIGDLALITVAEGATSSGNDFIDVGCPDTWTQWKAQHPGQTAGGNLAGGAYNNLAAFAFALPTYSGAGNAWWIEPAATPAGALDAVFVRPKQATDNVTYSLQYAATPGNPTTWTTLPLAEMALNVVTIADNGDCTETVTIHNLESLTTLTGGSGIVRLKVYLVDGQTTATTYTEVEGWKETSLASCATYNNPFLNETAFTGTIDAVAGQGLTFVNPVGLTITQAGSFYLEVTGGTYAGHRFDVAAASGYSVTLSAYDSQKPAAGLFNTLPTVPALAGAPVVIRAHRTLAQMFPVGSFLAADTQTASDLVQIFANGAWTNYWLKDGSPRKWVLVGDGNFADCANTVLPPGQGMFVVRRGSPAVSMLAYGEVRANDFIRPLAIANNLVAGGFPLDQSAVGVHSRQMNLTENLGASQPNSFFGSRDFSTADSFFVWKADTPAGGAGYDTYFLLSKTSAPSVLKWVKAGDSSVTNQNDGKVFYGDRSVFIRRAGALDTYRIPCPWAP